MGAPAPVSPQRA